MSDETYPDSLPFKVLNVIGRTVFGKNRSTTLAASAANAMQEAQRLGYLLVPVPDGMSVEDAEKALADAMPQDPDADLIEAMARTICEDVGGYWAEQPSLERDAYRGTARAALAVVREHEAGQR